MSSWVKERSGCRVTPHGPASSVFLSMKWQGLPGGGHDFLFSLVGPSTFEFVCDRGNEGRDGCRGWRG